MDRPFYYLQQHAQKMLALAINHGDLIPAANCQKCGAAPKNRQLDGHHPDYSKPLEVVWLCRSCHKKEHYDHIQRSSSKTQATIAWFVENPEHLATPSRELVERLKSDHIEVSHMTIHNVQQQLKAEKANHDDG
jgi:post-segregation antitoxin (ccd killing protein)